MKNINTYLKESLSDMPFGKTIEEVDEFCNKLKDALSEYPFVKVGPFGKNPNTIIFADVAFNSPEEWSQHYYRNSDYYGFSLNNKTGKVEMAGAGSLELTAEWRKKFPYNAMIGMNRATGSMRAFSIKSSTEQDKVIKKIVDFLKDAYKNYEDYMKQLNNEKINK